MTFLLISCGTEPVKFDPDFWLSDYKNSQIVSERNEKIKCSQPEFNNYAAMSREKILELADILRNARVPKGLKSVKKKHVDYLDEIVEKLASD